MKAELKESLTDAMKSRDKVRTEVLRRLLSAIQYEEVSSGDNLRDDGITAVLKRELKKSREELEFAQKAARPELIEKIEAEIKVIENFLPSQLNREQLCTIVKNLAYNEEKPNVGSLMKALNESYSGQYDGKMASEVVQEILQQKEG